jgi:SAM-dependent methyltransferase
VLHKRVRAGIVPITISNQVYLMLRRWQLFGPKDALRYYGNRAFGLSSREQVAPPIPIYPEKADNRQADEYFGLEAEAPAPGPQHTESKKFGLLYERSSETIFRHVMRKISIDFEKSVFIDLGAGKGFALCLAAEFPFKRVIGVEYSNKLAAVAAENLRSFNTDLQKCPNVTCVLGDATEFVFPEEPTVLYLYNPFQGEVMDKVIANLKRSLKDHPREVWVFYANPWEHRKFKRIREFEVVEHTWDYALYHHQSKK